MRTLEQPSSVKAYSGAAIRLLEKLIELPSFSCEEGRTADLLDSYLRKEGLDTFRMGNNVWVQNKYYDAKKPTILLNSHHDTVKPNAGYTIDPFGPFIRDGKLYGLGSNDAGGALVALLHTFLFFNEGEEWDHNLLFAATAEEENSGKNGLSMILPHLGKIDMAIVGEPTGMNLAVAEKGLMVLDCIAKGIAGHAARNEGENAIYNAMTDLEWFRTFQFPKSSELLGPVKMSVTMIRSGTQHNVVPDQCEFTVDVRTTDAYSNTEVLEIIRQNVGCVVQPRSLRLNPSSVSLDHPLVKAGLALGRTYYGSPTLSDQALMDFPSVKIGPGESSRSHTADEFIYLSEIGEGIALYINMLKQIMR